MNNNYTLICSQTNESVLLEKKTLCIGRDSDADWQVQDEDVSRQHVKIYKSLGGITLVDLNSLNGTYVNDVRISNPTHIRPGDHIRIGQTKFQLHMEDNADATRIARVTDITRIGPPPQQSKPSKLDNFLGLFPFLKHQISDDLDSNSFALAHSETVAKYIEHFQSITNGHPAIALFFYNRDRIIAVQCVTNEQQNRWTMGRSETNYILINDPSISKQHAELSYIASKWLISDSGSKNGIRLLGKSQRELVLKDSDDLRLGNVKLYIRIL